MIFVAPGWNRCFVGSGVIQRDGGFRRTFYQAGATPLDCGDSKGARLFMNLEEIEGLDHNPGQRRA